MKPVRIPAFSGMNNRLPDFVNRAEKDHFLRTAVNVDLTQAGTIRRRKGTAQAIAGSDCHSLFAFRDDAFFVDYDELNRIDPETLTATAVDGGYMTPRRRASYSVLPDGSTLVTNGAQFYRVVGDDAFAYPIPLPPYDPEPVYSAVGSLKSGVTYQFLFVLMDDGGVEGGSTIPVAFTMPADGGVQFPVPTVTGYTVQIYMTPANGADFFAVDPMVVSGIASITLPPTAGRRCRTKLLAPIPTGIIVRNNNGRVFTAAGSMLYYSEPYLPGLYNPLKGFIPFPADITMVEVCGDGLYVSADQTYWFGGDIASAEMVPVLPYRAITGAASTVNNTTDIWWMSERGMVVANEQGNAKNVQEKDVAVQPGVSGAALYREQDGVRQLIASVFGDRSTVAAASSWMEAEIVRKETVL